MVLVPCVGLAIVDIQQVSLKSFVTLHHDQSTASFSHQTFGEKYNYNSYQQKNRRNTLNGETCSVTSKKSRFP